MPLGIEATMVSQISRRPHPDGAAHGSRRTREDASEAIAERRKKRTAASVPRWSSRSNASSGSRSPKSRCARSRCPELLTGRNSVAPWSSPRRIDCRKVTGGSSRADRRPGALHGFLHHAADPAHGGFVPPFEAQHQHRLGVGGPDQPPPAVEEGADPVDVDHPPRAPPDVPPHPFHHPELVLVGAIHPDLGGGHDGGKNPPDGA